MATPDKIHITVLAEDIENGTAASPSSCPIALAFKRQFPTATSVAVEDRIEASLSGETRYYAYGDEASEFISHFDEGEHVEPFEFDADAEAECMCSLCQHTTLPLDG